MANFSSPHLSNSLCPPSAVENPTRTSIVCPLSLFDSDACDRDVDLEMDPNPNDDDDQVSFVTNLFFRPSENDSDSESPFGVHLDSGGSEGIGESTDDPDLKLGLLELGLGLNVGSSSQSADKTRGVDDLRVLTVYSDSDSDSDDGCLCSDDVNEGFAVVSDFDRPPFCWDYLGFNNRANNVENSGLEGRDYSCQNHESDIELSSVVTDDGGHDYDVDLVFLQCCNGYDDNEGVHEVETPIQLGADVREREVQEISSLFDSYLEREDQEIVIQSDMNEVGEYGVLEAIRDLEWEIMLALDNFRREMQDMDFDGEAYGMDFNEDGYEAIFREMEDRMSEWRRSPPTAKSVVENLPTLRLSAECLEENDVCAICKDDILGQGTVRQLPCLHYYHGDCILPWLKMHNTCPLCRHELPTDDLEYEYMKREREGLSLHGDVSVDARSGSASSLLRFRIIFKIPAGDPKKKEFSVSDLDEPIRCIS